MRLLKSTLTIALFAIITNSFAQVTEMKASTKAPAGIKNPPQFIVIGSDDNTSTEGVNWLTELISSGKNTDGSERYISLYVNSHNSSETWEKVDGLKDAVKAAYDLGHEVSNHTATHMRFVGTEKNTGDFSVRANWEDIYEDMKLVSDEMEAIGIPKEHQYGFRTPYLSYSDSTYIAMQKLGFLYDCSINAGYSATPGKANFPYTLDSMDGQKPSTSGSPKGNIPPDNQDNWWGQAHESDDFPDGNPIREHKGLWTIPCSKVEIAEEDRDNVAEKLPDWADYIKDGWVVTGLDYNLWTGEAQLDSGETVRALINTVKKTMDGNRAPFAYGMHSQYYFATDGEYGLTKVQRQGLFEEFVRQASEIDEVFFVSGDMVIAWMQNPCEAEDFRPEDYHRVAVNPDPIDPGVSINNKVTGKKSASTISFAGIKNGQINLQLNAGNYLVELYNLKGRLIKRVDINAKNGINATGLKTGKLSKGVFVLNVKQNGVSVLNNKITVK